MPKFNNDIIDSMRYSMEVTYKKMIDNSLYGTFNSNYLSLPRKSGKSFISNMKFDEIYLLNKEEKEEEMKHDKIMNKLRTKVFKDQKLSHVEKTYLENNIEKFMKDNYDTCCESWNIKLSHLIYNDNYVGNYKEFFKIKSEFEKGDRKHLWIKTELKKVISDSILKNDKSTYHELYSTKRYTVGFFVDENKVVLHDKKEDKSYFRFVEYDKLF